MDLYMQRALAEIIGYRGPVWLRAVARKDIPPMTGYAGQERDTYCEDMEQHGFMCTRAPHTSGRHIADGTEYVVAAWPGDHEPTPEDL